MSCKRVQPLLVDYLEGTLAGGARESVAAHLEACDECASMAAALEYEAPHDEDLTRSVLRRTAQAACTQSVERLPDWVDGALDALDAELVAGHTGHCAECRALAAVLRAMAADLPELAEIEPDAAFVDDVMHRTAARLPRWVERALPQMAGFQPDARFVDDVLDATTRRALRASWGARFDRWLESLLRRPRIAWEGAYVASVLLALLVAVPGSPLAGLSTKALDLARTEPDTIERPFVALRVGLDSGSQEAWNSTRFAARSIVVRASVESGDAYRKARRGIGTLWDRIASERVNDGTRED